MADTEPHVSRPKPTATWNREWYAGPIGSALHHERLAVAVSWSAHRPEPDGRANRIDVTLTPGSGSDSRLTLDRRGAELLHEVLTAALAWTDGPEDTARPDDEAEYELACAWADFRKNYGVSADQAVREQEHRAFMAGWDARAEPDDGGPLR